MRWQDSTIHVNTAISTIHRWQPCKQWNLLFHYGSKLIYGETPKVTIVN